MAKAAAAEVAVREVLLGSAAPAAPAAALPARTAAVDLLAARVGLEGRLAQAWQAPAAWTARRAELSLAAHLMARACTTHKAR